MTSAAFVAPTPIPARARARPAPRAAPPRSTLVCALQSPRSPPPARLLAHIASLSARARGVKCPFWRRRFTDALEATRDVLIWALRTRHKSLPLPLPPAEPLVADHTDSSPSTKRSRYSAAKRKGLSIAERVAVIRDDFVVRQYYVTGRLSTALYRDDCLFDGPDPDGRVRGTRKFCDAASGLFDARGSRVDLIDVYARFDDATDAWSVVAEWRLEGMLKLPWRPAIKPYVGATTYRFDDEGLVREHVECWSVGVVDAFVSVVVKGFGVPAAPPASVLRQDKLRDGTLHWHDGLDLDVAGVATVSDSDNSTT